MEQHSIGELLKKISCRMGARADAEMKEIGLTFSQARVIGFISRHGRSVPLKSIEEGMGVSHPTTTGIVRRLEAGGFVTVSTSDEDRRSKIVTLTDKAGSAEARLSSGKEKLSAALTDGFTKDEKEELFRLLSKLEENMK